MCFVSSGSRSRNRVRGGWEYEKKKEAAQFHHKALSLILPCFKEALLSEHVCSVVLLVLLLWRWMCLFRLPLFLCYSPCVQWFLRLRCLLGLWWSYPLFLSTVSHCGGVVSSELGLSSPGTESVCQWSPRGARGSSPPLLMSGGGCVWCDLLALVLAKVLAIRLVFVPRVRQQPIQTNIEQQAPPPPCPCFFLEVPQVCENEVCPWCRRRRGMDGLRKVHVGTLGDSIFFSTGFYRLGHGIVL